MNQVSNLHVHSRLFFSLQRRQKMSHHATSREVETQLE